MTDLLEPQIETCLKPVDFLETLADLYRRIETCPQFEKSKVYLEQCAVFRGVSDPKYERREDELIGSSAMNCRGRNVECPKATLQLGYDLEPVFDLYRKLVFAMRLFAFLIWP
ncbi:hypothetical protein K1719_044710 [Acacia pycnantha]|nr:hypothetical protein K1719_044710 [Acacia pycnantha]